MIEKHLNMIRKLSWIFTKRHPHMEFDDLYSEACVAYLEGEPLYNPSSKASESTFLWMYIEGHLQNYTSKWENDRQHYINTPIDILADHITDPSINPERSIILKEEWEELMEQLSPEATAICHITLMDQSIFLELNTPKLCRGKIKDAMRQDGWAWKPIWDGFREIKAALR